jgi:hypothetical protein
MENTQREFRAQRHKQLARVLLKADDNVGAWRGFRPQPYQQLAKVLREAGDNVGARRVLVAMENSRRKYGKLKWWSWLWRWVLRFTISYVYRPWYALIWALLFISLGSTLFWRNSALITPSDKETYEKMNFVQCSNTANLPDYYQAFSPVVYAIDTFFPIINFGQKDHWMPNPRKPPSRPWLAKLTPGWITSGGLTTGWLLRFYLWFHIAAGWILGTLFVAGFTSIVRNE